MRKICIGILIFTFSTVLLAQNYPSRSPQGQPPTQRPAIGVLRGIVVEATTTRPIEYAAITLLTALDSSIVTGTITNPDGMFILDKIPVGKYRVKISFIGFKPQIIDNIIISPKKPQIELGVISLSSETLNMQSVTVTGENKAVQYNLDKKIVTVDNEVVTMGGTAIDVMQNIPSVSVDLDGNVSLRGSTNVTMLIDGRPSQIISLDQIPASMIDHVEIITNPSARYDAEGMSGIINIVLKKKRTPGYNGMILLNAGSHDKYNVSTNLNYRINRLNLFVNYDGRFFNMIDSSTQSREFILNDTLNYLNQNQSSHRKMQFQNFKFGSDYTLNRYNTISLSGLINQRGFNSNELSHYQNLDSLQTLTNYYTLQSEGKDRNGGTELALNYKKTFDRDQRELTGDIFYSLGDGNDDQNNIQQQYELNLTPSSTPPEKQSTYSDRNNRVLTLQSDYVHPFLNGSRFETGYKSTFRRNDSDYRLENFDYKSNDWINDSTASNHFIYDEQVHAVYGIYSGETRRFQYQTGLRLEYAYTNADQKTTHQDFVNDYLSLFPTLHLRFQLAENQGLQLSYSRRINRPRMYSLNPFVDYEDPQNLRTGNPQLKPQYVNALEFSHSFDSKSTNLSMSLFYRQVNGLITSMTSLRPDGTTMTTFENLNNGISYGLEFVFTQKITKWWRINANTSYFHTELSGPGLKYEQTPKSNSWSTKINSYFYFTRSSSLQFGFMYFSPVVAGGGNMMSGGRGFGGNAQGTRKANYFANLGFKQDFLNNKLSLMVRVGDLLKSTKMDMKTVGENFTTTSSRRREGQIIFVGVSYKINEPLKKKERKSGDEEEQIDMEDF